jgi:hypothetical protein
LIVIRRNPVNRLAALIRKPGGISVAEALQAAQDNLNSVREQCLSVMDEKLGEIAGIVSRCKENPADADLKALYALGNDVLEVAGVFGMNPLSEAAFSLCDLLDRFKTLRRYSYPALVVHLQALQALRASPDEPGPEAKTMLDGLRRVVDTIARSGPTAS